MGMKQSFCFAHDFFFFFKLENKKNNNLKNHTGWNAAENYCVSLGGHLASIHNDAENQEVYNLCKDTPGYCWIGLSSDVDRTNWVKKNEKKKKKKKC